MVRQRPRRAVPVGKHGAPLYRRTKTGREQRLIAAPCLPHKRPDNAHERMLVIALPGPGNSCHGAELRYADCLGYVRLVLLEKAPQHCSEPEFQPASHCRVQVVLVVPEFVRELSSLHRERDRDDDVSESPTVGIVSNAAREAKPVSRIDRRPASRAHSAATREDGDEMVAVRLAELEDRRHERSGPDEIR